MLDQEEWMDIRVLAREGHTIKAISRLTGRSRNTVRRAVRTKAAPAFRKPRRHSALDPFKNYLEQRFKECGLSALRLLTEIRPMGFPGSVHTVRRFVAQLRGHARQQSKMTVRFETPPGHQAQADWAHCGRFPDASGKLVAIYAFVFVLGFSRMLYTEFTRRMTLGELIRCHRNAFEFLGGWPRQILFDNMAQVRLDAERLHPLFGDFAAHHGFAVKTHRVRRPRTKGKVERSVAYVESSFLNGRSFADLADLNAQARSWLNEVANVRLHATTGERPIDLWPKEGLTPYAAAAPYRVVETVPRTVDAEGFVRFEASRFSVPPRFVGQRVLVGRDERKILIRAEDCLIAEHEAPAARYACIALPAHVEEMWKLSLQKPGQPPPSWKLRFDHAVAVRPLGSYEEVLR